MIRPSIQSLSQSWLQMNKLLYYLQESDIEAFVTVSTVNEVIGTWNTKKNHI